MGLENDAHPLVAAKAREVKGHHGLFDGHSQKLRRESANYSSEVGLARALGVSLKAP